MTEWQTASGDTVEVFGEHGPPTSAVGRYSGRSRWYWHVKSPNDQIIAASGESFTRKSSAKRAALRSFPKVEGNE